MSPRERAARALYEREPLYFHPARDPLKRSCVMPWEEADDGWRAPYYARVDAVLDEIRTPSEADIRAGGSALDYPSVYMGGASKNGMRKARAVWDSMIDSIKRGEG